MVSLNDTGSSESLATAHEREVQEAEGSRKSCIHQPWCLVSGCILMSSHDITGNSGVEGAGSGGMNEGSTFFSVM